MSSLHLTRGIPASGKSTFARAFVAEEPATRARVNRDDLRMMLFGADRGLSFEQESELTKAQRAAVTALLDSGMDVVVDDMHLRDRYIREWAKAARGHEVVVHDFEVSLEDAVRRDSLRPAPIGAENIRKLYERFTRKGKLRPVPDLGDAEQRWTPYLPDESLPEAFIVDIDGTLAHRAGEEPRSPYDMTRVSEDIADSAVADLVRRLGEHACIVLVSGRNECARADTARWLHQHRIDFNALFMRPDDDGRGDDELKHEILHRDIAQQWNVLGVFDDRRRVVEMWREVGLKCFQVQDGDF